MEPKCMLAFFADSYTRDAKGFNFFNITTHVTFPPPPPGVTLTHIITVYTTVYAAEGAHTLMLAMQGRDDPETFPVDIRPQDKNVRFVGIKMVLPVAADQDGILNSYPLLLDGHPLTTLHLIGRIKSPQ